MKRIITLSVLLLVFAGCQESEQRWGQGETPQGWRDMFGDGNLSRLNYVQSKALENHQGVLHGVKRQAEDGTVTTIVGLIKRIELLEKATAAQHKKMGEVDIAFHKRMELLESENDNAIEKGKESESN